MTVNLVLTSALGFALAAVVTPVIRAAARRIGAVAKPKADRWHKAPTAMLGGVAIFIATMATAAVTVPASPHRLVVLIASSALFLLGLFDDFRPLKPYQKLAGQLLGAAAVVYFGLVLPWTDSIAVNMLITFVWLVGVTNAVNMLDNMDGLSAGVAAIAALSLSVNFHLNGQTTEALLGAAFCGALVGFLLYNRNPASIFMGDCGSLFVGFFLASTALLSANGGGGRSRSVIGALAVPILVLCIPIFDTTFVTLMRKLAGRAASQGGRDHTSHRLVALGLSERHAVWMLYAFAAMGGALAISVRNMQLDVSLAAIATFAIILGILGAYLAGVRVYSEEELAAAKQKPLVAILLNLSHKQRIFEVLLDVSLIVLAHYGAYALLFGPATLTSGDWQLFFQTIPAILFVKLAAFLATGVYRGLWKYAGVSDLVLFGKAVVLGEASSVLLILTIFRFEGFSRTAFALDALLLFTMMGASRFAFRVMRRMVPPPHSSSGKRVVIYGAGDAGDLLWRELLNNNALGYVPVAFVDDDPRKSGRFVHGLRVYSGADSLVGVCREARADEVFLSTHCIAQERVNAIVVECETAGLPVKRLKIDIQRVADSDLTWMHAPDGAVPHEAQRVLAKGAGLLAAPDRAHSAH